MGYDIHITRKEEWFDEEGDEISLEEWQDYVTQDPEVERDPRNGEEDFIFSAHSNGDAPLWWSEGEVYSKNPDEETRVKMFSIAQSLNAKVQGDEGEVYDAAGQSDEQRPKQQPDALATEKRWWQFWK